MIQPVKAVHRASKKLKLAIGVGFCLAQASFAQASYTVASTALDWRSFSRVANRCLDEQQYSEAIAAYKRAIATIKCSTPGTDQAYDLYLNLAEAYRRNGDLQSADLILDDVGPKILSRANDDPLLPARYWRRRSDLLRSQGDNVGFAEAKLKCLRIIREHTPNEYRTPVRYQCFLLEDLCQLKLWKYAAQAAADLNRIEPASAAEARRTNDYLSSATPQIRDEAIRLVEADRMADALDILVPLSSVEADSTGLKAVVGLWHQCLESKGFDQGNRINRTADALRALLVKLQSAKMSKSEQWSIEQAKVHLMLARVYYLQGKPGEAATEAAAGGVVKLVDNAELRHYFEEFCSFCFARGAERMTAGHLEQPTEQLLREARDLYPQPSPTNTAGQKPEYEGHLALYTLNHARILNLLGHTDEAAKVIDSIPQGMLDMEIEGFWARYVRINCRIANSQLLHGQDEPATQRFQRMTVAIGHIKNKKLSMELQQWLIRAQRKQPLP